MKFKVRLVEDNNYDPDGRIQYEDDLVVVKKDGEIIYKGIEDYEPMRDEPWKYDGKKYVLDGGYTKELIKV